MARLTGVLLILFIPYALKRHIIWMAAWMWTFMPPYPQSLSISSCWSFWQHFPEQIGCMLNWIKHHVLKLLRHFEMLKSLCLCVWIAIRVWFWVWFLFSFLWILQEFGGNMDKNIERYHYLNSPFTARFIRFHPIDWQNHISMRAGLIGCPYTG